MSTTTYTHHYTGTAAAEATPSKSFWRRVYDRLVETQQRRADREIARFLESHGGLLTDDMERQIMESLTRRSRPSV